MPQRLLIITCHKLSDNNGGANASKGFIYAFAKLFEDCSLIYPEFDEPREYIPEHIRLFPCHDSRRKLQKGLDMYRGVVNALYSFVIEHLRDHNYDVIVIDHSVTGTGIIRTLKRSGAKLITIHHNVERDYLRDNGNERPVTFRYPYNFFAKKSERDCLRLSNLNLTLTKKDAETFRSWYKETDIHAHCIGICEYKDLPEKSFPAKPRGNVFAITGSLCFIQSLLPIIGFIENYYPILKEVCPDSRLIIAGRNPAQQLIDICADKEGIEIIPDPENMEEVVRRADYYICPINAGSGIKLRVMDGLKQGLPVLCHKISANGYEGIQSKGCIFPYDDVTTFKMSLKAMLSCSMTPEEVYNIFRGDFSLKAMTERIREILQKENI